MSRHALIPIENPADSNDFPIPGLIAGPGSTAQGNGSSNGSGGYRSGPEPSAPDEIHPFKKIHLLFRGRYHWAFLLGILGAAIGGSAAYFSIKPQFQSTGLIQVETSRPKVLTPGEEAPMPMWEAWVKSQVALLKSRRVLDMARTSPDWKAAIADRANPPSDEEFANSLEVLYLGGQREVYVTYSDRDPRAAMMAVKSVIDAYMKIYAEHEGRSGEQVVQFLEQRKRQQTQDLKSLRDRVLVIAKEFGTDSLDQVYDFKLQEVQRKEAMLQDVRTTLATSMAVSSLNSKGGGSNGGPARPVTPEDVASLDPKMRRLLDDKETIERNIAQLTKDFGDQYREVVKLKTALSSVQEQIDKLMARYVVPTTPGGTGSPTATTAPGMSQSLAMEVEALKAKERNLSELLDASRAETLDIGNKRLQIRALQSDIETTQDLLKETNRSLDQLNAQSTFSARISVVSTGDEPFGPFNRKRRIQTSIVAALALGGLGIGLIGVLGFFDRRLHTIDDARSSLADVHLLGILPRLPSNLNDPQQAAVAAHCVHQIRTLVQIGAGKSANQVFAVTSPAAETGKTSLTIALGLSFAACGSRTLLIDTDMVGRGLTARTGIRVPDKIGQIFIREGKITPEELEISLAAAKASGRMIGQELKERGLVTEEDITRALEFQSHSWLGLLDVCGGAPLESCIAPVGAANLFILPVGSAVGREAVVLSPITIRKLINDARGKFDTVLLDTGPVPGSLEGSIVSAESDGVVLVVSQGDQRPLAEAAASHLKSVGARILGLVFNRAEVNDIAQSIYMSASREQVGRGQPMPSAEPVGDPVSVHLGPIASAVATYAPVRGPRRQGIAPQLPPAPVPAPVPADGVAEREGDKSDHLGGNSSQIASADIHDRV